MPLTDEERRERDRERKRRWRENNPEKARESDRRWRENNLEKERERSRRWRENNPEKERERSRRWRENNPEKARERKRRWCENNPEKAREITRRYFIENPLRGLFLSMKQSSKKRGHPFDLTFEELQQHYINHVDTYGHCCAITGVEFVNESRHPHRCSVDRIDSEEGYTLNNIIFVTKEFNVEKKNLSPTNTLKLANFLIERRFSL